MKEREGEREKRGDATSRRKQKIQLSIVCRLDQREVQSGVARLSLFGSFLSAMIRFRSFSLLSLQRRRSRSCAEDISTLRDASRYTTSRLDGAMATREITDHYDMTTRRVRPKYVIGTCSTYYTIRSETVGALFTARTRTRQNNRN